MIPTYGIILIFPKDTFNDTAALLRTYFGSALSALEILPMNTKLHLYGDILVAIVEILFLCSDIRIRILKKEGKYFMQIYPLLT